jgi:hypothetical protein
MGELIDDAHLRLAREDGIDVHFLQHNAAIVDFPLRDDVEVADLRFRLGAPVRLHQPDDRIDASTAKSVRILEHRIRLTDARCGADVDAQPRPLGGLHPRQQLLHRWVGRLDARIDRTPSSEPSAALYELFTPSAFRIHAASSALICYSRLLYRVLIPPLRR